MLAVTLLSIALLLAGRQRLLRPADEIRERYELCDDVAQMLTERAAALFRRDESEAEVSKQMRQALSAPDSWLSVVEAEWVVARLAELLCWGDLGFGAFCGGCADGRRLIAGETAQQCGASTFEAGPLVFH
jgi:hypothetical protein